MRLLVMAVIAMATIGSAAAEDFPWETDPAKIPDSDYVTVSPDGHLETSGRRVRFWGHIGHLKGSLCCLDRHGRGRFPRVGDAALDDPRPRTNPVIGGIHHFSQVVVGQNLAGNVLAPAHDLSVSL